jgi:NADPH:quinone reductase-like Zn-dependent oxidoreductase
MKAVVVKSLGGPERLQVVELPMPMPAAGEVTIKVSWAGVNFIDVYMRRWRAQDLFSMVQSGTLEVMIEEKIPLELAAEAHRRLESRQSRGKLLLQVDG